VTDNINHGVLEAGIRLRKFIDKDHPVPAVSSNDMTLTSLRPLVVLAFDEAHDLTDFQQRDWSIYSELRRCLCQLVSIPIFTLFLSTAGKFRVFSPAKKWDPSSRVVGGVLSILPPITETGFDQLAKPLIENQTTLDDVVEDEWICSLGRPLCVFLVCTRCRRTHVFGPRVGLPPVMPLLIQNTGSTFEQRSWSLLLRSFWVDPATFMSVLAKR
jgi:hypothetical protein